MFSHRWVAGSNGGSVLTGYATIKALLAAHTASPLADGTVWFIADVDGSSEPMYGSVSAGALTPDPARTFATRGFRSFITPRVIQRPATIDISPAGTDWL